MRTLDAREKAELLRSQGQRDVGAHRLTGTVVHWPYCVRCGIIALKNDVTRKALKRPCVIFV